MSVVETCPPEQGRRCFDQLPSTIERLLTGRTDGPARDEPLLRERFDRVALIYLDAFGWTFLERQGSHPLLRRARADGIVTQLTSQFPSTTSAHVTTIHSGLPVADHGVYEWHVLEPTLNRLITPLPYCFAGDGTRDTLAPILAPEDVFPAESLYARLREVGVHSCVAQPQAFSSSPKNRVLLRGADVVGFPTAARGLAEATAWLRRAGTGYVNVYLDDVDGLMHEVGPDDPAVDPAFRAMLNLVERAAFSAGTLVLLTADHGMSPVDPARTVYVNHLWPELGGLLKTGADGKPLAPAGSCRDLFLHVRAGEVETVRDGLAERLEGVAEVATTSELVARGIFDEPSARLSSRLGDIVVLPRYGEAVYWLEPGRFEQHLRGQHGGLTRQKMEIPLVAWVA